MGKKEETTSCTLLISRYFKSHICARSRDQIAISVTKKSYIETLNINKKLKISSTLLCLVKAGAVFLITFFMSNSLVPIILQFLVAKLT